jgi:hypothetical protein
LVFLPAISNEKWLPSLGLADGHGISSNSRRVSRVRVCRIAWLHCGRVVLLSVVFLYIDTIACSS